MKTLFRPEDLRIKVELTRVANVSFAAEAGVATAMLITCVRIPINVSDELLGVGKAFASIVTPQENIIWCLADRHEKVWSDAAVHVWIVLQTQLHDA